MLHVSVLNLKITILLLFSQFLLSFFIFTLLSLPISIIKLSVYLISSLKTSQSETYHASNAPGLGTMSMHVASLGSISDVHKNKPNFLNVQLDLLEGDNFNCRNTYALIINTFPII